MKFSYLRNMKNIAATFLLSISVFFTGCISEGGDEVINRVKVGDPIPAFTVKQADGTGSVSFEPGDFVGTRSVIVLFQTSCGDCKREMPKIHEAWKHFFMPLAAEDVQFVLISRAESAADVTKYWTSADDTKPSFAPMPYYLDPNKNAFGKFANSYVPRIYLVGTDGKVKYMAIEKFDFNAAGLIDKINDL